MAERAQTIAGGTRARAGAARASGAGCASDRKGRRVGAALLEVVVAVSILAVAMGVIGFAFRNGQLDIDRAELRTRAMIATEQVLTNIDLATLNVVQLAETSTGGQLMEMSGAMDIDAPPGMGYRVVGAMDPAIPGAARVQVEIYDGDPTDENSTLVMSTMVVRAPPRPINLGTDFGLSEEQLQQLTDAIPGGAAVLDPAAVDPAALAGLPLDMLEQILPMLLQAFGGQLGQGQVDEIMKMLQSGDAGAMQQLQPQMGQPGGGQPGGGDQQPGGGAGPKGRAG